MEYKLLACAFFLGSVAVQGAQISPKISGGVKINEENEQNYRYVAMIHAGFGVCSAFVVSETTVITAASCFDSFNGDYSTVFVMDAVKENITVHENYNKENKQNNIAIIHVKNITYQEGLSLSSVDPEVDTECVATGYGIAGPDGTMSMTAYYEKVVIAECGENSAGRVCAGVKTGEDVHGVLCKGDVGAPLICNNELVGLAVSDSACGSGGPDEYQNIKEVKNWIEVQLGISTTQEPGSASTILLNPFALITTLAVIFFSKSY